jgi:predicted nucleotidyltransferase
MSMAVGLAAEYAELIRHRLGARVKEIILFGSQARGDADARSDYDCVVVVDQRTPDVREVVLDADVAMLDRHDRLFAALIYGENEWRRAKEFPLGWNIRREGIAL